MGATCDRCHKQRGRSIPSIFNNQMICRECALKEMAHEKYPEAHRRYIKEAMRGNPGFPGIGLPTDLVD